MSRIRTTFALFRRTRTIAVSLARHGLGFLVVELGLARYIPFRRLDAEHEPTSRGEHLRRAIEEIGATFVKIGQILSTRPDLLPADVAAQLAKLQDAGPPEPWERIRPLLEKELGMPVEQAFARFEPVPFAAASIGQVHRAVLPGGAAVAVKVQRPDVGGRSPSTWRCCGAWPPAPRAIRRSPPTSRAGWSTSSRAPCATSSTTAASGAISSATGAISSPSAGCGCRGCT